MRPYLKYSNSLLAAIISFVLAIAFSIAGCKTTKIVTDNTAVHKSDTAASCDSQTVNKGSAQGSSVEKKDTAITVPGGETSQDFTDIDLKPAVDAAGDTVGRFYRFDQGHVHGEVTVDPKGKVNVKCKADSLQMVIRNLVREKYWLMQWKDSTVFASNYHESRTDSTHLKTVIAQETGGWLKQAGRWVWNVFAVFGILCLVWIGLKIYTKA
jgi:hypothetical protein